MLLVNILLSQLVMMSLCPENFSTSEVVLSHLWTYSNCCQVCSVQVEHSVLICVERSKQNGLHFNSDHAMISTIILFTYLIYVLEL